jgi:hypothetical protein
MSVGMRGGFNTGIGIVRIDADQRGELGLLRHDGRGIHVGLNLADPISILGFALGEEGGDVGAEAWRYGGLPAWAIRQTTEKAMVGSRVAAARQGGAGERGLVGSLGESRGGKCRAGSEGGLRESHGCGCGGLPCFRAPRFRPPASAQRSWRWRSGGVGRHMDGVGRGTGGTIRGGGGGVQPRREKETVNGCSVCVATVKSVS